MIQLNSPIFINVEYSRSFIKEYPVCSSSKNIILPYPSIDPVLLSGSVSSVLTNSSRMKPLERDKLIFYQGGHHGSCLSIRTILSNIMKAPSKFVQPKGDKKREIGFLTAKYCPIPIGDSPSSKRMYDVIHVRE